MHDALIALGLCALAASNAGAHCAAQLSLRAPQERPAAGRLNLLTEHWITAEGVVRTSIGATLSVLEYELYKTQIGDPHGVLSGLLPASQTALETTAPTAAFDDETGSLRLARAQLGLVRFEGEGVRSFRVEDGLAFDQTLELDGRPAVQFKENGRLFGLAFQGVQRVHLPAEAKDVEFDAANHSVRWRRATTGWPASSAQLTVALQPIERVLSGAYKAYGFGEDNWVGQLKISNGGPSRITRFAARHRVEGYSEWSPWAKLADIAPGESAVQCLYPILSASTAQLKSDTPAHLFVEWRYVDGDGQTREDSDGARLILLGGNEFIFARTSDRSRATTFAEQNDNSPLLAAWVSRDDAILREVAALGAKRAGGAAANENDYAALATLKGLYEVMVANDVTYQHPPALSDTTLSFIDTNVQNVKFPRDVLRDRSGTCIDLAILYAALVHATGLPALLCVVPGHCFPVAGLPDGQLAAVEVTGVGGGGRMGADAATFGDVFLYGQRELAEALAGPHVLIDLRYHWTHGVSCPELPPVAPDFVEKTQLREKILPTKLAHLAEMREDAARWFSGAFELTLDDQQGAQRPSRLRSAAAVDAKTFLLELTFDEVAPAVEGQEPRTVRVTQVFEGRVVLNLLHGTGLLKTAEVLGSGAVERMLPDTLELSSWNDALQGELRLTSGDGSEPTVWLVRQKQ